MNPNTKSLTTAVSGLLLSILSLLFLAFDSGAEPYFFYRRSEALYLIGGSFSLITLWVCFSFQIVLWSLKEAGLRLLLVYLLMPLLLVPALCSVPTGYLADLKKSGAIREETSLTQVSGKAH